MQYHGDAGTSDLNQGNNTDSRRANPEASTCAEDAAAFKHLDTRGRLHNRAKSSHHVDLSDTGTLTARESSRQNPFSMSINFEQYNDDAPRPAVNSQEETEVLRHGSSSIASDARASMYTAQAAASDETRRATELKPLAYSTDLSGATPSNLDPTDRRRTTMAKADTLHMDSRATVFDLVNGNPGSSERSSSIRPQSAVVATISPPNAFTNTPAAPPTRLGQQSAWSEASAAAGGMTTLIEHQTHFDAHDAPGPSHPGAVDLNSKGKAAIFTLVMSTNFLIGYTVAYVNFLTVAFLPDLEHQRTMDFVYYSSLVFGLACGSLAMLLLSDFMSCRSASIFSYVSTCVAAVGVCFSAGSTSVPWNRFILGFWATMGQGFTYQYVTQTIVLCPAKTKRQMRLGTAFAFNIAAFIAMCMTLSVGLHPDTTPSKTNMLVTIMPIVIVSLISILVFIKYLRYDTPQDYIKRGLRVHAEAQLQNIYEANEVELLQGLLLHLKDEMASREHNRSPLWIKILVGAFDPSTITIFLLCSSVDALNELDATHKKAITYSLIMGGIDVLGALIHMPLGAKNVTRVAASVLQFIVMIPTTVFLWRTPINITPVFILFLINNFVFTIGYGSPMWPTVAAMKSLIIDTRSVQIHLFMIWMLSAIWILLHEFLHLKFITLGICGKGNAFTHTILPQFMVQSSVINATTVILSEIYEVRAAKIPQSIAAVTGPAAD